jgi:predicted DNA-binding protein with PD1-like motif
MRSIDHPGIPGTEPLTAVKSTLISAEITLQAGTTLMQSAIDALGTIGAKSAVMRLEGGAFMSFCYVMPALSDHPEHSVYFSQKYNVAGRVALETACLTYGERDGKPWLHCHAIWIEPDGARRCGHLLPESITICEPIQAFASILQQATYCVAPDAETNFSLFKPVENALESQSAQPIPQSAQPIHNERTNGQLAFALRIAPNQDVCLTLESFCAQHGIDYATVLGGVGSTVGAVFDDNTIVEPYVTEMLIRQGSIRPDEYGQPRAALDISMVDYLGEISEGRLKRGENPVLVTFELVLLPFQVSLPHLV